MNRKALASVGLGLFFVACASGTLSSTTPGTSVVEVVPGISEGDARLRGLVTHRQTGEAMAGVLVVAHCTCLTETRQTETNVNGTWAFGELPAGTYTVQILHGGTDLSRVVELQEDGALTIRWSIDPTAAPIVT